MLSQRIMRIFLAGVDEKTVSRTGRSKAGAAAALQAHF
jgi:hypothetical protein